MTGFNNTIILRTVTMKLEFAGFLITRHFRPINLSNKLKAFTAILFLYCYSDQLKGGNYSWFFWLIIEPNNLAFVNNTGEHFSSHCLFSIKALVDQYGFSLSAVFITCLSSKCVGASTTVSVVLIFARLQGAWAFFECASSRSLLAIYLRYYN